MRALTTRVHGMIDYFFGLTLIAAPWLPGFAAGGAETWVPVAMGALLIGYSLITDYEFSLLKWLQIPLHLWLDGFGGVLLAVSPWLFNFDQQVWLPHVVIGALQILSAFLTQTVPGYERRGSRTPGR
ncbi:SPW repeat protein [soil metagenome]